MSSKDIDRGALWFSEITDQLANTSIGIVCLTKENKSKPWILFESGALAKGLSSNRVCTFLIDLVPTDLENPLAQFNHTFPSRESVWELVRTINLSLKENALKESVLSKVFDTYWPQFEGDFKNIIKTTPETEAVVKRNDNDIMLDVLSTVRMLDKRLRNIEVNSERENVTKGKENIRTPISITREEFITHLKHVYDESIPDEVLIDTLSKKFGLPRGMVRHELRNFKEDNEVKAD